jgi:hypothetical protein
MQVGGDVAVNDLDDAGLTGPAGRNAMLTRVMEDVRCLDRRVRGGGSSGSNLPTDFFTYSNHDQGAIKYVYNLHRSPDRAKTDNGKVKLPT